MKTAKPKKSTTADTIEQIRKSVDNLTAAHEAHKKELAEVREEVRALKLNALSPDLVERIHKAIGE